MTENRGITLDLRIPAITNQQLEAAYRVRDSHNPTSDEHQLACWFLLVAEECRVLSSHFLAARPKGESP